MFVLNKNTGLKWDVEGDLLERLKKDPDYELVKESKVKKDDPKKEIPEKKKPAKK